MITVQPIRYTAHPEEWHRFAKVLGFVPAFPPERGWSEWDAGGVFAVHAASSDRSGRTDFHVRVDDLAVVEVQLEEAGIPFERSSPFDVGPMLSLVTGCADAVSVSGGARAADSGPLKVLPIWYPDDVPRARRALEAIGLRPRIGSDSGGWIDFVADGGGLAALHRDTTTRVELSMEYAGDLDAFAGRLVDAGLEAIVIDESYSRTIRVTTPDGDELWINGAQDDLYGFARLDSNPRTGPTGTGDAPPR